MNDSQPEIIPSQPAPAMPEPARKADSTPATRRPQQPDSDAERRDFFNEAMREILGPLSTLIERKINPVLAALEQIPDEAQRLADGNFGLLDQPSSQPQVSPDPHHIPLTQLQNQRFLRPPGANSPGSDFESVCSRCGNCVTACPAHAIKMDANGLLADGFPYIIADTQPCVVCTELACMKSCPTGALKMVERLNIDMGTAKVDHDLCLRNHGEACTLCLDVCPLDGKDPPGSPTALFVSQESGKVRVRQNTCIGCGLCENRCPTEPRAITITPYVEPVDPIIA
jgi:ferredoxin-type protein NapG